MQQIIQCPRCAQRYQAAPEWAGRTTNCPACGTLIQIPPPQQAFSPPALEPLIYNPQPAKPPAQPAYSPPEPPVGSLGNGTPPMVWLAIGGGIIAVFFVFTLGVFILGRSFAKQPVVAQVPVEEPAQAPVQSSFPAANPPATNASRPAGSSQPSSSNTIRPQSLDTLPATRPPAPSVSPPAPAVNSTPSPTPTPTPTTTPAAPPEWANKEDPKPAPNASNKKSPSRTPAEEFGSQIIIDSRGGITFGPAGCPVAVTGNQVWDINTKKVRSELEGRTESRGLVAISPDGNTVAAAGKSPNQEDTEVVVWDSQTGKQKFTAPGDKDRYVDTLYLSDQKLFLGGRDNSRLDVWDLETGEQGKSIDIPGAEMARGKVGFTLDGNYLAVPVKDRLTVFRTSTGKMAAYMGAPKGDGRGSDAVFVYAWLQSLEFSEDSLELAGVSTHPSPHVMCWDNKGKLVFDQPFHVESRAFWENTLQWFPNRQAWLIERDIFDRTTGKIVLTIRKPWAQDLYIHVHDDDHLVGTFPSNPTQLEVLEIPWEKIRASQEAMKTKQPALLSPALPVSLLIELGDLRGDKAEVSQLIETSFVERLKRDGFTKAVGGKTYFRIKFAEAAGDQMPIFERQRFQWGPGRDTGRKATEAKGDLVVELFVVGRAAPIWRDTLKVTSSRSFNDEINDTTVRKSMLDRAASEIRRLNFPYFIPESEDLIALPVVVQ